MSDLFGMVYVSLSLSLSLSLSVRVGSLVRGPRVSLACAGHGRGGAPHARVCVRLAVRVVRHRVREAETIYTQYTDRAVRCTSSCYSLYTYTHAYCVRFSCALSHEVSGNHAASDGGA